jgi:hypothetical protein
VRKLFLFLSVLFVVSCSKDPVIYTLTTFVNPSCAGTVSPTTKQFEEGETVMINVTNIAAEYEIHSWTGASGNSPIIVVVMNSDKSVTANFIKRKYYLTNLITSVEGEGSISKNEIVQGHVSDCNTGTILELTAIPKDGWELDKWSGDITGTDNPQQITITVDESKTVKALFKKIRTGFLN